ncbi:hypothetical protein FACS1894142_3880 [Spirochaetia bacterium]|nr:hypothetical protein FACS1894142_3880 [Spirochaetia bacterium]
MRNTLNITAHSGCDGTDADSIESVIAGIANGADAVEVDVRFNRRHELILSHNRDETGEYPLRPRLAEAFEPVLKDSRIGINCDIKERETVPAVLKLAEKMGLGPEQLILTGSSVPSMLEQDREIVKKASLWLNIEEIVGDYFRADAELLEFFRSVMENGALQAPAGYYDKLIEPLTANCLRLGVKAVNMPFREAFIPLIPHFIARGLQVSVWTLNNAEALKQAVGLGVLNITTRDTRLAVAIRISPDP